jgi:hypothetical protein
MEGRIMANGPDEPPWAEPTAEEQAEYARRHSAAHNRHYHVPARDPAERAEYDRQEAAEAAAEAAEDRFIHFHGIHVQDSDVEHGNCVDSCPYDSTEQAEERARLWACAEEARKAEYAAENEVIKATPDGTGEKPGGRPRSSREARRWLRRTARPAEQVPLETWPSPPQQNRPDGPVPRT